MQVNLCGHVTLAASHALFSKGLVKSSIIEFETLSGILIAKKIPDIFTTTQNGEAEESFAIELNFPTVPLAEFNSADVAFVSRALNGANIIDIKKTTTADDLFVTLFPILYFCTSFLISISICFEVFYGVSR